MFSRAWPWAKSTLSPRPASKSGEEPAPRKTKVLRLQQQYHPRFAKCGQSISVSRSDQSVASLSLQHVKSVLAESASSLQQHRDRIAFLQLRLEQVTAERDARPLHEDLKLLQIKATTTKSSLDACERSRTRLKAQLDDANTSLEATHQRLRSVIAAKEQLQKSLETSRRLCQEAEQQQAEYYDRAVLAERRAETAEAELTSAETAAKQLQKDVETAIQSSTSGSNTVVPNKDSCERCERRQRETLQMREQVDGALQASRSLQAEVASLHQLIQQQADRIRARDKHIEALQSRCHELENGQARKRSSRYPGYESREQAEGEAIAVLEASPSLEQVDMTVDTGSLPLPRSRPSLHRRSSGSARQPPCKASSDRDAENDENLHPHGQGQQTHPTPSNTSTRAMQRLL